MRLECRVKKSILVRTGYGAGVERDNAEQIKNAIVVDGLTGWPNGFCSPVQN